MEFYKYLLILSIIIILLLKGLYSTKFSPEKIKKIALVTIIAMLLRYISLIILFIVQNMKYLYMFKFSFFMNLVAVPIIALFVLYVFMRSHAVNFSYTFIASIFLVLLYVVTMYKFPCIIQSLGKYGYTMFFDGHIIIYWIYILINTSILFAAILFVSRKGVNRLGMSLVLISSIITILEMIMWIIGVRILPELVIGDMFWIITALYALGKVKRK